MSVLVRFAPSPTGYLHPGNIRTALINWLFAKNQNGRFLLRMDDTDKERSKPEYAAAIQEDLRWLGLEWDAFARQSDRLERYAESAEKLKKSGRLYAAYETPEELDVQRKMLASRGLPPVYNRAALKLAESDKQKLEAEGRKPHWRFLLNDEECAWDDLIQGHKSFKGTHMSDPVLLRADGMPVYTLASVVDDGELGITHVIRGEDHVSNTAVQVQIFKALGFTPPQFAHMALLKTKEGELSKRLGGNDIRSLREQGILAMAINAYLARIGTSDPVEVISELSALADSFDFNKFGRAPAQYDAAELAKLNEKLVRTLPYANVKAELSGMDEAFWLAVRGNVSKVSDAKTWWDIVHGQVNADLSGEEKQFVASTAPLLPSEPWDGLTYDAWMAKVKTTTSRKGKELFLPIRKALTGMEHGPELKALLPLLGREKTNQRLIG